LGGNNISFLDNYNDKPDLSLYEFHCIYFIPMHLLDHINLLFHIVNINEIQAELPLINYSSLPDGNSSYPSDLGGLEGSSNPGQSSGSGSNNPGQSSGSGPNNPTQPNGSGSNNAGNGFQGMSQEQFDELRRSMAAKLRNLYISRPTRYNIYLNSPEYSHIITRLDHNIVCKHILDTNSTAYFRKIVICEDNSIKYAGILTLQLLQILES